MQIKIGKFTLAYLECALWSSTDDEGNECLDENHEINDIAGPTLARMIEDCVAFQEAESDDLEEIDPSQAGHDFWLTRNRHGAGFWDRGLGEIGKRLTDAAHAYGSFELYVGDDGKVWAYGYESYRAAGVKGWKDDRWEGTECQPIPPGETFEGVRL
jgi:hypothetical protein